MAGFDDDSLSLESLLALVGGSPSRVEGGEEPASSSASAPSYRAGSRPETVETPMAVELPLAVVDQVGEESAADTRAASCASAEDSLAKAEDAVPAAVPDSPPPDGHCFAASDESPCRMGPACGASLDEPLSVTLPEVPRGSSASFDVLPALASGGSTQSESDLELLSMVVAMPAGIGARPAPEGAQSAVPVGGFDAADAPDISTAVPGPAASDADPADEAAQKPTAVSAEDPAPASSPDKAGFDPNDAPLRARHASTGRAPRAQRGKHAASPDRPPSPVSASLATPAEARIEGLASVSVAGSATSGTRPAMADSGSSPSLDGRASGSIDDELRALVAKRLAQMHSSLDLQGEEIGLTLEALAYVVAEQEGKAACKDAVVHFGPEDPIGQEAAAGAGMAEELESIMFDEPPASIKAGMREADVRHRHAQTLKAAAVAAACTMMVAVAVTVFAVAQASQPDAVEGEPAVVKAADGGDATDGRSSARDGGGNAPTVQGRDLSGSVVYRYATAVDGGEGRPTTETVTFGAEGLCETSSIEVEFDDEAAAQAFLDALERDFGSSYREGSVEGASAHAVVDVSGNKLDRESYEEELRVSVENLVIVKKS